MTAAAVCNLCGNRLKATDTALVKDGFQIVRCPRCGLQARLERPAPAEIEGLYGHAYFVGRDDQLGGRGYFDYVGDAVAHRRHARRRLDRLERFVRPGALLDVGCAAGFFLDEARARGWAVEGVDVAAEMVGHGTKELGLPIVQGRFGEQQWEEGARDCVTMWDYIEHSIDPAGDVAEAFRVLRPGGLLALSTGDAGSLVARLSGRRWHLLTPRHHNFFFTRATLRQLVGRAGFAIEDVRALSAPYSLGYLAHKTMVFSPLLGRLARPLALVPVADRAVPINLGDIMTLLARKPGA